MAYGDQNASREDVLEAMRSAQLDDLVSSLPLGHDTVVGERGIKLSGGERQRIAIARAILRRPRLLVCDEATSSLDSSTEAEIMNMTREEKDSFVQHMMQQFTLPVAPRTPLAALKGKGLAKNPFI